MDKEKAPASGEIGVIEIAVTAFMMAAIPMGIAWGGGAFLRWVGWW